MTFCSIMAEKPDYGKGFYNICGQQSYLAGENINFTSKPSYPATYFVNPSREPTETRNSGTSSHINAGFQQEPASDSDDSDSSQTESDSSSDPEWIENVGDKGDLFYVEPVASSLDTLGLKGSFLEEDTAVHLKSTRRTNLNENRIHLFQTSSGRTYQSAEGDVKELVINIDSQKHNYGRRTTLCETLLGIIPGEVPDNRLEGSHWDSRRNRIIVKGFAPDGETIKSRLVRIGDYLKCIDDVEITAENLTNVLSKLNPPCKVKLKIQSSVGNVPTWPQNSQFNASEPEKDTIVKYLTKTHSCFEDVVAFSRRTPHMFLFIRDSSNVTDSVFEDGVVYKYPKYENTLFSLTGAFITLNQMSVDVTGSEPLSSSLIVDDQLVHVAYHRENRDTVVLVLPATSTAIFQIHKILMNMIRFLRWQFDNLSKAFSDATIHKTIDKLLILFFHNMMSQSLSLQLDNNFQSCKGYLNGVPSLLLNSDTQLQVDIFLGELESGDFGDMSEAYYDEQRLYLITGSCLFYKGLLCKSHLHTSDLYDIYLYCFHHQLLNLIKQEEIGQLIVWREVFPSRLTQPSNETSNLDFKEDKGRWFVLMIALKHCLIAVLLKTGGCTAVPEDHPPPDPFYIDQTKNTLLRIGNSSLTTHLEKQYQTGSGPETSNADSAAAKSKDAKKVMTKQQILNLSRSSSLQTLSLKESVEKSSSSQSNLISSSPHKRQDISTILKKRIQSHLDGEKQQLLMHSMQTDGESDFDRSSDRNDGSSFAMESSVQTSVSSSSDAESRTSSEDVYRGPKSNRIYATTFDLSSLHMELEGEDDRRSTNLVAGCDNTLFQYLALNASEGILVSSLQDGLQCLGGPLHVDVLKNFQRCVSEIHHVFQSSQKLKEPIRNSEVFRNDRGTTPVKEHGVLFKASSPNSSSKKLSSIAYWVVGRVFHTPEYKEVYVCYQDSAAQNAIEMAFKLSFGMQAI